jgi:DNA-binding winged helix-turn-helix (wHTH) protein
VIIIDQPPAIGYFFGDYELDVVRGCLLYQGHEIPLRYQSFQLLLYFVEHPETLISKDELTAAIWSDTSVTDNALVQCVAEIRHELNDDPRNPRFIKTFPKVGYRFIAKVRVVRGTPGLVAQSTSSMRRAVAALSLEVLAVPPVRQMTRRRAAWILTPVVVVIVALLIYGGRKRPAELANGANLEVSGLPTLAVFPLANGTGRQDLDWLREGLSDMILTDLAHTGKWNVLSRVSRAEQNQASVAE